MEKLSLNERLDLIVSSLADHSKCINQIQDELKLERNTFQEVRLILLKLVEDKYAYEIKVPLPYKGHPDYEPLDGPWLISYKRSYTAKTFIENKGYSGLSAREKSLKAKKILKTIFDIAITIITILIAFMSYIQGDKISKLESDKSKLEERIIQLEKKK